MTRLISVSAAALALAVLLAAMVPTVDAQYTCSNYYSSSSCNALYNCWWCSYGSYCTDTSNSCSSSYSTVTTTGTGMAVGVLVLVIVAPIVCCLCIVGIVVYLMCRKPPVQNTVVMASGAGQPMVYGQQGAYGQPAGAYGQPGQPAYGQPGQPAYGQPAAYPPQQQGAYAPQQSGVYAPAAPQQAYPPVQQQYTPVQ